MRKPIVAANWKMHRTVPEAERLARKVKVAGGDVNEAEVVLCPPFTALQAVGEVVRESTIALGAQDVFWEPEGAYTGEVSAAMLQDLGCAYCIVGHSERRAYFHERDEDVRKKAASVVEAGMGVIVCVGERLEERQSGRTESVVLEQISGALEGLTLPGPEKLVIAYEPVWAIGTGEHATPEQANAVTGRIRTALTDLFGRTQAEQVRIQYGGSVKPDNIAAFMGQSHIDGALVGGASLDAAAFSEIVRSAAAAH